MKYKWIALLLALSLVLCASGCSMLQHKKDPTEVTVNTQEPTSGQTEQTEPTTTQASETEEPTTEAPTEPTIPLEDQLALIAASCGTWMNAEEMFSPEMNYTVTDLDQNGRLEVLFGCVMGTGIFTYVNVWQVNEDCTALEKVNSFEEGYSQADMILSQTEAYYDREADVYYYIFSDDARSGWMWNGTDKRAVWLKDGALNEETLASRSCDTDEAYNSVTTYFDAVGASISEAEFEAIAATVYADLEKLEAAILWQSISWEELESVDANALLVKLQEAAAGFSVG